MIPISKPSLSELEARYVNDALDSTWISSTGRFIDQFEELFAVEVAHSRHALTVTNGTVALHLAMAALDVGPGDEVIVPSLTYIATANAVRYMGAKPVFADVQPGSWCLDPQSVAALVGPRTVGIIAVHLYGHPADMDALQGIADRHGLWLVEDAAEAPFATYKGLRVGSLGDVGTFSFYGNKLISSGEGGAVTTNQSAIAERMRLLRGQGMDPQRRYYFPVIGYNFRMTNVAAAILVGQIERREELLAARRNAYRQYQELFSGCPAIGLQPVMDWAVVSPWLFCVTVEEEQRDAVASDLQRRGIETRPFFVPLHTLPPYQDASRGDLGVTESLAASGLNLPTFAGITEEEIQRVATSLIRSLLR